MSKEILQDIIENFNPEKFIRFFRNKSNNFSPIKENLSHYNDEIFNDGLKLGEIKFNEVEKLIICIFKANQPLSERSGKKTQYEKGKKILKDYQYDAGIFIFYDNKDNFRFSLIYSNYFGEKRDWSTFRRFTYLVESKLTNKTFIQRIGDGDFSFLEKIKDAFSVEKVTKEFYKDIANWYFWTVQKVKFPKDAEAVENGRNIAVIRLITRIIFVWFMCVRGLVPKYLFSKNVLSNILKDTSPEKSTYYMAILQNLFFATLNTKNTERNFYGERRFNKENNPDGGDYNGYRYHELLKDSTKMSEYFNDIPFLNGGLFECLDDKSNGIFIDGFSDNQNNQPLIPNYLFFSGELNADLNIEYGTKNKSYKVRGLIDTLSSYNFTIDENDLDDQEVALDPELLGRVFENLLASFNPETSTTARKATGSYYTPREIVDYMVTGSLKAYFKTHLSNVEDLDTKIDELFLTANEGNPFNEQESKKLVELIEGVRIVDPAVGSGAFPMGALNKLVFILNKVDPGNELWKQTQLKAVDAIPDPHIKKDTKNRIEEFFKEKNADYGRKLYLIQKCIYGVDIQQIAVEIAKLRVFISLLVDERIDKTKENWGIEPLPNLDFKIMQGNSLVSEFLGIDFDKIGEKENAKNQGRLEFEYEGDNLIKEFEHRKIDYQNESNKDKKIKLIEEIENLLINIFETKLRIQKIDYFNQLDEINRKASLFTSKLEREKIILTERQKLSQKTGFDLENIEKQLREFIDKKKVRPFFPWKLYFSEVFNEKEGFDIVIANPPYGDLLENNLKKTLNHIYSYSDFSEISSLFIEKSFNLLRNSGNLIFIITFAITFGKNFSKTRHLLKNNFEKNIVFTFDRDRCSTFESMTQSVSIIKCLNKNINYNFGFFTSRFFRTFPNIYRIEINNTDKLLLPQRNNYSQDHRLPKIGEDINKDILEHLFSFNNKIYSILNQGEEIWIRTSGNYWYNAFTIKPYSSCEIKSIKVKKEYKNFLILLINSNLFYFWFRVYGDGRHMNKDILANFPSPSLEVINNFNDVLLIINNVFMEKLFSIFDHKRLRFETSKIKNYIDFIDLFICKYLYNFNDNFINHIVDYDSEIRGGKKIDLKTYNEMENLINNNSL